MEPSDKKCPRCAEMVKAEARVCRFCGYDFETQSAPTAPRGAQSVPESTRGKPVRNVALGCLVIVVLLIVIGALLGPPPQRTGPAAGVPGADLQAIQVTARELAAAYAANEAAAQQSYGNRVLEVSGTVSSIQLGITDEPFLVLEGANPYLGPQASLSESSAPQASSVVRGQTVRLRCTSVSEIMGTPMLRNCDLL